MNVVYIIETKNGGFKPFVAQVVPSEGDNDSSLFPIASGEKYTELKDAQSFATNNAGDMKVYINPVKSNMTGITWLSELELANK